MSADPAGFGLVNPMRINQEGRLVEKQIYSVVEGLNWYSYVGNNPVVYTDPTGAKFKFFLAFGPEITIREFFVIIFHPFAAAKVFANKEFAEDYAREARRDFQFRDSESHNGRIDAFRHAIYNAMNARDIGEKKAKRFGDAHEAVPEQPDVEREMDLHNNEVGRKIGAANPDATNEELYDLVKKVYDNGELINSADPKKNPGASYNYGKGVEDNE